MRFSRYAFVAALLALGVPLAAQQTVGGTITGKVTDAETKLPILDARVVIAGGFEATTNQTGDYRLVNVRAGAVQVRVFRIGFASSSQLVNVIAAQATTANFRMTKSVVNLSEVVVTGTDGRVRTGFGPFNWTRRFDPSRVKRVVIAQTSYEQNGQRKPLIQIEADRTIKFGSLLPDERRAWMLGVLHLQLVA